MSSWEAKSQPGTQVTDFVKYSPPWKAVSHSKAKEILLTANSMVQTPWKTNGLLGTQKPPANYLHTEESFLRTQVSRLQIPQCFTQSEVSIFLGREEHAFPSRNVKSETAPSRALCSVTEATLSLILYYR
jgi:hypothetical protein